MIPESPPDPIVVAVAFTRLLDRVGVAYVIGGSLASSIYGEPRSTNDIDVVADFHLRHIDPFVDAVADSYYVRRDAVVEAVTTVGSFNVIHLTTAIKIDVFVAGDDAFEQERLRRRVEVRLSLDESSVAFVDTAEHCVLRKLEWYRRGMEQSDRQWRDVIAVIREQGERLDRGRLERWAEYLNVADLLRRALGHG